MMRIACAALAVCVMVGCEPQNGDQAVPMNDNKAGRFTGTFEGEIKYRNSSYPIVVLRDSWTGQEYVLVRGFGSSMLVNQGKVSVEQ